MRRAKTQLMPKSPKSTVYAVLTHEIGMDGQEKRFIEMRVVRDPRMLIPYAAMKVDCMHDVRLWQIYHDDVAVKFCRQSNYWDDEAHIFVYGDVIDLHLVTFPRYCNDPFWQQFANPLMAYSGHGLAYEYWLLERLPKPCGTDHTDYFAAVASMADKKFDTLPPVKALIKDWSAQFNQEKRK